MKKKRKHYPYLTSNNGENIELFPVWVEDKYTVILTDGNTEGRISSEYGKEVTLSDNRFISNPGYELKWEDNKGNIYENEYELTFNDSTLDKFALQNNSEIKFTATQIPKKYSIDSNHT